MTKIKKIIFYIFLLVIVLLGLSFATLNAYPVAVNYYLGTSHIALSLLLVYTLGVGAFLGLLALLIPLLKLKKENRSLKKMLKKAEVPSSIHPTSTQ